MLKFISFGSGSSGNCYYIYTENHGVLIDAGVGVRKMKKYFDEFGLKQSHIKYIIVTHDHADHIKSVGAISDKLSIPVYATKEVHKGILLNYCVHRKVNPNNVRIIKEEETLELGDFKITCFKVPHDSLDNIGFFITYEDIHFCIMTDIGHITPTLEEYINKAHYLVIEANHDEEMLLNGTYPDFLKQRVAGEFGHLSNRLCAKALKENASINLRHIWLCHLSEENNHPELARKTIEMELSKSNILNLEEIKLDVLRRTTPSEIFTLKDK